MALIQCPECGKDISDAATSCPHCGYPIAQKAADSMQQQPDPASREVIADAVKDVFNTETPLGEVKKNPTAGIVLICAGIVTMFLAVVTFFIFFLGGIFFFIVALFLFAGASNCLGGSQPGTCPYCNNAVSVVGKGDTFKCPKCKKISARTATHLRKTN